MVDRFWRAPDALKGGSGLGLAIVARLVQASAGQISLRPAPGTGLDVAVTLRPVKPVAVLTGLQRGRHSRRTRSSTVVAANASTAARSSGPDTG